MLNFNHPTRPKKQCIQNPGRLQERVGPLRKRMDDFEKKDTDINRSEACILNKVLYKLYENVSV